ncbi:hypothetical protein CYMTET_33492, partial [Cymbomonas tetramitiformis]
MIRLGSLSSEGTRLYFQGSAQTTCVQLVGDARHFANSTADLQNVTMTIQSGTGSASRLSWEFMAVSACQSFPSCEFELCGFDVGAHSLQGHPLPTGAPTGTPTRSPLPELAAIASLTFLFTNADIVDFSNATFTQQFVRHLQLTISAASGVSSQRVWMDTVVPGSVLVNVTVGWTYPEVVEEPPDSFVALATHSPAEIFHGDPVLQEYIVATTTAGYEYVNPPPLPLPPSPPPRTNLPGFQDQGATTPSTWSSQPSSISPSPNRTTVDCPGATAWQLQQPGFACAACPEGFKPGGAECVRCSLAVGIAGSTAVNGTMRRPWANKVVGKMIGLDSDSCVNTAGMSFSWLAEHSDGVSLLLEDDVHKASTLNLNLPQDTLTVLTNYRTQLSVWLTGNADVAPCRPPLTCDCTVMPSGHVILRPRGFCSIRIHPHLPGYA